MVGVPSYRAIFSVTIAMLGAFLVAMAPGISISGEIVKITTEKRVYTNPEPIYLLLTLAGLEAGYPVDIAVSLELPDGTSAFLGEGAEFSPNNPFFVVRSWPFSALRITSGTWPIRIPQDIHLAPGLYTVRADLFDSATEVLIDRSEAQFTIVDAPYLDRVEPQRGITGTVVVLAGEGFGEDEDLVKVFIGGREATIMELTDTSIRTWVPYGATTGTIKVLVDGVASNELQFQVGPYIKELSSSTLSPGSTLTIQGFNFDPDKNKNIVSFNGIRGTVTQASETKLSVLVPDGNTGPLTVTANDMTSTPTEVTITPVVESIDPPSGEAGDVVTISGRNFSPVATDNYVVFNAGSSDAFAAVVVEASTNQLIVRVPEAETGDVKVYTNGEEAQGDISFTYPPEVDSVDPQVVVAGDTITISGRNFEDKEEKNAVLLGDSVLTIVSAVAHTITCKVPLNGSSGELKVIVNGMESKGGPFVAVLDAPRIDDISPLEIDSTDTRTSISVAGSGFTSSMTVELLKGSTSTTVSYSLTDYSSFTFKLPRGTSPGTYTLQVTRTISGRTLTSNTPTIVVR